MGTIDWEVVSAVSEALGALGVVLSMTYLALQIRQNTISNRIAAKQNTTNQFVSFTRDMTMNAELAWLFDHGRKQDVPLDEEQSRRFHYMNRQLCWYYSSQWYQHDLGAISRDDWEESLSMITNSWLGYPGVQAWWRRNRAGIHLGFRRFVESELMPELDLDRG